MQRNMIIALVGSLAAVGLAFLVVVWLVPGGPVRPAGPASVVDIRGKWRPSVSSSCSDGLYLIIRDDKISWLIPNKPETTLKFDVQIEKSDKGPVLKLHPLSEPPAEALVMQLDTSSGRLRFVSAEWTQEAIAQFGSALTDRFPASRVLETFQKIEPFYPCP